ncbi:MAG: glycosyltransferase family 39 protein [Chloroflexota bacterium]
MTATSDSGCHLSEAERRPTARLGPKLALAGLLVAALVVRLWRIDAQSIWFDEGWSIHLAGLPLRAALAAIASEGHTHPPGYYLLLMLWTRLSGLSVPAVRGLSAVLGAATVWAVYLLGRELYDRATGWVAAFGLAVAPAHILYSQETRMYALLVLCVALLTWLYARLARVSADPPPWRGRHWLILTAVEVAAIYTHFYAFFAIAPLAGWFVGQIGLQMRRPGSARDAALRQLRPCLLSQAAAAAAFLPWLGIALRRVATHAPLGTAPPSLPTFVAEVWSFLMGGHIAVYGRAPHYATAVGVSLAVFVGVVLGLMLLDRHHRRQAAFLAAQGLVPFLLLFALVRLRPGYHPRYLLMLIVPVAVLWARGLCALARMRWPGRASPLGWMAAALLAVPWVASYGLAARALATDPYYDRDDARAVARYLRTELPPSSTVWVDMEDWALRYYLAGSGLDDCYLQADDCTGDGIGALGATLPDGGRAALVRWRQGTTDHRDLLPYLLEHHGAWLHTERVPAYYIAVYALDKEPAALLSWPIQVDFGPLRLVAAATDAGVPSDEALAVALGWRLEAPTGHDLKAVIELTDAKGRSLARQDAMLLSPEGLGTSRWPVDVRMDTFHTLHLSPGIAPLTYTLVIGAYHAGDLAGMDVLDEAGAPAGKRSVVGSMALAPARGLNGQPLDRARWGLTPLPEPVELAPGLQLAAFRLDAEDIGAGDALPVLLEWRHVAAGRLPDYHPELRLVRAEDALAIEAAAPVYGQYPTDGWQPGEVVLDWRTPVVPSEIGAGRLEVRVAVSGWGSLSLGTVAIQAVAHRRVAPAAQVQLNLPLGELATLVGYDLEAAQIEAGQPLTLTLHWRAEGASATGYVVFAHLLDEAGRLIAQHDAPPANGERPTTGWVRGEYIGDRHVLAWVEDAYQGAAAIEVGLYDPLSMERLLAPDGASRLLLPSAITVQ